MAVATAARTEAPVAEKRTIPVKWWAGLGAALILFQVVILARWISGPYFDSVDPGPTPVPDWMKVALVGFQIVLPLGGLALLYRFVVRPWRRDRHVGIDGLLVVAFFLLAFHDPLSAYQGHWYAYNSWQVNMGSWVNGLPGAEAPGTPDHQVAYPLLIVPGAYMVIFLLVSVLGCAVMRKARERRPGIGKLALCGIVFCVMVPFDLVFEGVIFMPLGSWSYPGGHLAIFPDSYHKYPLNEALTTGAIFTMFAAIRFFVNDRGQTLAERGTEQITGSPARVTAIRGLAVTGLVTLAMTLGYTIPNMWVGAHSDAWPADHQERSYLNHTCGEGPGIACPGPDVPHIRNDNGAEGANLEPFGKRFPPDVRYKR